MHKTSIWMGALLAACTLAHAAGVLPPAAPAPDAPASVAASGRPSLAAAQALIRAGQPQAAIARHLDALIAEGEARYDDAGRTYYCAHTDAERLAYAAVGAVTSSNRYINLLDGAWADAIFLRGFAEVDLGDLPAARRDYARALALSPRNPHYLSEMGELHSTMHDWQGALAFYGQARDDALAMAVPGDGTFELARALRGIGYVDVELVSCPAYSCEK
ncbi:MAG: hypothetical protein ABJD97_21690 [Betaproteobacteria bacterium]